MEPAHGIGKSRVPGVVPTVAAPAAAGATPVFVFQSLDPHQEEVYDRLWLRQFFRRRSLMVSARRRQILAGLFLLAGVCGLISSPTVQGQDGDKGKGEKVHFLPVD